MVLIFKNPLLNVPFWFSGSCFGSDWGAIEADPPAGFVLNDEGVYNLHSMRLIFSFGDSKTSWERGRISTVDVI